MGEAAFAFSPPPKRRKPKEEWAKDFTDAEIRRALERLDLTAREHMLLERLCGLSLQEGYAWLNQDDLAALVRCSVRTLYETTSRLCKRGLLETTLTLKGLHYFPQWEVIGLERDGQRSAKPADPDRQNLPMLLRSRIRSRNSENSSRRYPAGTPETTSTPSGATAAAPSPSALLSEANSPSVRAAEDLAATRPASAAPCTERRPPLPQSRSAASTEVPLGGITLLRPSRRVSCAEEGDEEANRRHPACRDSLATEGADLTHMQPPSPAGESQAVPLSESLPDLEEAELHEAIVLRPLVPLGRVPPPTPAVLVAPDRLAQVLEKFGPEAHADALEVLRSWPARQNPDAATAALTRLLEMQPCDIQKSAGACFRSYLRLASAGQLRLAKTHPGGGTQQARLVRALDLAEQSGDQERIAHARERLWQYGVARREQVRALRQLEPQERPFFSAVETPPRALTAPSVRSLPAPTAHDLHAEAEALRAQLALPIFPSKRAQLERALADVEAAIVTKEPSNAQQGQQTSP